jgi:hypothetical protein
MSRLVEGRHAGEFLLSEANGQLSRDTVVLAASQTLEAGAVLGRVTANGQYKAYAPAASDGTETAVAILWEGTTTGASETRKVGVITNTAEVLESALVFTAAMSTPNKDAAIADLEAQFIKAR